MDDPNTAVRRVAIASTITDDSPAVLDRLLRLCVDDPDETVRRAAAERLAGFAFEAEVGKLDHDSLRRIEETLVGRVRSEAEALQVRAAALTSAGFLSTEPVQSEIRKGLANSGLQIAAIRAIARNLDPRWTAVLEEQMADDDPIVRQEAAVAAAEYEETVGALGELVDDPEIPVRLAAISSLGKIGGDEAYDFLVYCHESSDPIVKEAAEKAMQEAEEEDESLGEISPLDLSAEEDE